MFLYISEYILALQHILNYQNQVIKYQMIIGLIRPTYYTPTSTSIVGLFAIRNN